jgi:putative inorganic carbon (HCO3(-)) transporter
VTWPTGKLPFIPASLYSRFTVIVSDTIHPNVMAGSLVILLQIPLAWLFFSWRSINRWQRLLAIVAVLGMSSVLFLTKSRGAWMAFAIALVFMILLRWRWGWVSILVGGLAGGIGVYILGFNTLIDFLLRSDTIGGVDGRIEVWSRAIYMIQDFPFTGIGMGTFTKVADTLYPFFTASPGQVAHAHNLFLQIAVDLGIPGLIAWLAVLLLGVTQAWQVYRLGKGVEDAFTTGLGAGLLVSQLALIVHGMTDAVTWGMVKPAPLVWVVWGLAIAGGNIYRNLMKNEQAQPVQFLDKVK